jgi:Domain found in Dishevelled, Egl-10, and Pleckstrin (DEP)
MRDDEPVLSTEQVNGRAKVKTDEQALSVDGALSQQMSAVQLQQIAEQMQGVAGVHIADHRYRLRVYPKCFRGDHAVDWLMSELALTRSQALRMGERLHAHRLIRHVLDEHDFADSGLFYRFVDRSAAALPGDSEAAAISEQELRELVQAMRGRDGPKFGTHYHHLIRYPNCFDGRDAVTWLVRRMGIGRPYATAIGRRMLRRDFVRHVLDEHDFEDRRLFYRFV